MRFEGFETRVPRRRGSFGVISAVVVIALLGAACGSDDDSEPSTGTRKVVVASGANPYLLQAWAAEDQGYLAERGLELEFISTEGGGAALAAAVASGEADFFNNLIASVAAAVQGGQELGYACGISNRTDRIFLVRPEVADEVPDAQEAGFEATVQALRGMTMGVVALGSGNHLDAVGVLNEGGVDEDELTFVGVGGPQTAMAALEEGQVDVVPAYGGLIQEILHREIGVPVLDYARDVPAFGAYFNTGWVASIQGQENSPELIEDFCDALAEGTEFVTDSGNRDEVIALLEEELGYETELAAQFTDGYFTGMFEVCLDTDAIAHALEVAERQGLIESGLTADDLLLPGARVC